MKATLEVPDELMRRAEGEAARQGITVDQLVQRGIACVLPVEEPATGHRATFPIFTSKEPGTLHLTNEDIRRLEEEDDLRKAGILD